MEITERSDAVGGLTLSNIERGRSRNPHPVASSSEEVDSDIIAPVSQTAIQPRRETTTITPILEEAESEASGSKEEARGEEKEADDRLLEDMDGITPVASAHGGAASTLPILRVNSEDLTLHPSY